jgi:hypothetical protein
MRKDEQGFVQFILLIIIALVAAKYFFNWSIFEAAQTPEGKGALDYLKELVFWLKDSAVALWSYIH